MPFGKLRMSVPNNFNLAFYPLASLTIIIENRNSSWIDFDIETNNPLTLKIKPDKGCIEVGREVHILISRPRILPPVFSKEYIIFKIKYCYHNKLGYPNAKYPTQYQRPEMQEYIIYNKITDADVHRKQTYWDSKTSKNSKIQNQLPHRLRIHSNQQSVNSISTDSTRLTNDVKIQRKNRHPFTIYQPFFAATVTAENDATRNLSLESFRHISPLKHTEGVDKNISAINEYIEQAKILNRLLKRDNVSKERCDDAIDFDQCHLLHEETVPKTVDHQKFEEIIDGCNCKCQDIDICLCCECNDCLSLVEDYHQNHEDFLSYESNPGSCLREVNKPLENTHIKKKPKVKKRKVRHIATHDDTEMAQKSKYRWLFTPIFLFLLGIVAFHSWCYFYA